MKKFLSLILALAMVACMSVTAFAADNTTVLTVEVPENTPSYTFHCPSSVTLEYGETGMQPVGDYYLTDVRDPSNSIWYIQCAPQYTDLINTKDPDDTISLELYRLYDESSDPDLLDKDGTIDATGTKFKSLMYNSEWESWHWTTPYQNFTLKAQVSDWSGATPGATYQATITYVVSIDYLPW